MSSWSSIPATARTGIPRTEGFRRLKTILIWLLAPLTAIEALWVRLRATRLGGAEGDRSGACGEGAPLYLLAIGDSIIDGVGAPSSSSSLPVLFAFALSRSMKRRVHWRLNGQSGLDIHGLLQRLDSLDDEPADVILISIGVNDVTGLTSQRTWSRAVRRLLDRLGERWPSAWIIFAGLPPMAHFPLLPQPLRYTLGRRAGILDAIAAKHCAERSAVRHVPTRIDPQVHTFSEDGYHPSSESCTVWAEELASVLRS